MPRKLTKIQISTLQAKLEILTSRQLQALLHPRKQTSSKKKATLQTKLLEWIIENPAGYKGLLHDIDETTSRPTGGAPARKADLKVAASKVAGPKLDVKKEQKPTLIAQRPPRRRMMMIKKPIIVVRDSTTSDSEEDSSSSSEDDNDETDPAERITAKRAKEIEDALKKCQNEFANLRGRVRKMETVLKSKKEARDRVRNKLGTLQMLKLTVRGFLEKHGDRTDDLDSDLEDEYEKLRDAVNEEMGKGYSGSEEEDDEEYDEDGDDDEDEGEDEGEEDDEDENAADEDPLEDLPDDAEQVTKPVDSTRGKRRRSDEDIDEPGDDEVDRSHKRRKVGAGIV